MRFFYKKKKITPIQAHMWYRLHAYLLKTTVEYRFALYYIGEQGHLD